MGPRAGLDVCEEISHPPGFELRNAQPVASPFTDWYVTSEIATCASPVVSC